MDNSTEGVTLNAGFISDLLSNFEHTKTLATGLFDLAKDIDLSDPSRKVPMALYNDMCAWIETNLGPANLRKAGEAIGARAYEQMVASKNISPESSPSEILEALKAVTDSMIQDPKGRGWTILESGSERVVMRRTQSFNSELQFGLLRSLVERSQQIKSAQVTLIKSVAEGDEFDDYKVRWVAH